MIRSNSSSVFGCVFFLRTAGWWDSHPKLLNAEGGFAGSPILCQHVGMPKRRNLVFVRPKNHGETTMVQKNMDDALLEWVVIHVWEQHFLELRFSIKALRIYHVDLFFFPDNELDNVAVAHGSENSRIKADGIKWCLDHTEGMKRFQRVYFPTRDAAGFDIARSSKNQTVGCLVSFFFNPTRAPR